MKGRVALVTGGGRGIGREAALLLAATGARVMVASRSAAELAAVGLDHVVADLGTSEGCARAVAETEDRLGPIELLVVNHGIGSAHERLIWEQDPEVWRETMRINLDGPFELARLTVGGMCKRGYGRVVFTSSTAGEKAERSGTAYTASKHGVLGLARAIAQDAGPFGVTSNAVLPGWVRTAMAERSAKAEAERRNITVEEVWRERAAIYPQNRVLEPREVAEVIAFLCSDAAPGASTARPSPWLSAACGRRPRGVCIRPGRTGRAESGDLGMSDDLAKRIDRLESIEAIKKLKHVYMNYCDLGYSPDKLCSLFTDDAVWTSRDFGHHVGRAALGAFWGGISARIVFAAHLAMNSIIEVDGDSGTGKWRILMPCTMMEGGKKVSRWLLGDYDEQYVRIDGAWKFKKIDFVVNYNVPFDQSWAESAVVRPS